MANQTLKAAGLQGSESPYGAFVARETEDEKTNSVVFPSTWTPSSFVCENSALFFYFF